MHTLAAVTQHWLFVPIFCTVVILALFPLVAGYLVLIERKILADFQVRLGPMRVGPHGLLQPLADALKLLLKEDIIPSRADKAVFWMAPVLSTITALTAFTTLPFTRWIYVADVNVGLLVILAAASVGVLGTILGGWSSNSNYPLLGALRSSAQLISYEVALGFALLPGLMAAGTLSMQGIVRAQLEQGIWFVFTNFGLMLIPFVIFFVSATAETNRTPFDLPEAESELTGGFHTEYSGLRWGLFMLSEYGNLFVASAVMITVYWGGWLRPFPSVPWLALVFDSLFPALLFAGSGFISLRLIPRLPYKPHRIGMAAVCGILVLLGAAFLVPPIFHAFGGLFWFLFKVSVVIYVMFWLRGTFPRLRYDQLMDLGWKWMIPMGMAAVAINALVGMLR